MKITVKTFLKLILLFFFLNKTINQNFTRTFHTKSDKTKVKIAIIPDSQRFDSDGKGFTSFFGADSCERDLIDEIVRVIERKCKFGKEMEKLVDWIFFVHAILTYRDYRLFGSILIFLKFQDLMDSCMFWILIWNFFGIEFGWFIEESFILKCFPHLIKT